MASDLFDQLAESDVPPAPPQLERGVHQRLNKALLFQHLWDLVLCGVPYLIGQVAPAWVAAVKYTISGRYPKRPGGNKQDE